MKYSPTFTPPPPLPASPSLQPYLGGGGGGIELVILLIPMEVGPVVCFLVHFRLAGVCDFQ